MISLPDNALRGSYPPLVTPFLDQQIDRPSFSRLVDSVIRGGSHGLVVNGTTGEPTTLSTSERTDLVDLAVRSADGRVPVIAATGGQSYSESLALLKGAEQSGATAAMIVTPYFIRPPVRGLIDYYVSLAATTRLPILIYHIPGRAAVSLPPSAIAEISAKAENLVGVKHASQDLSFVSETLLTLGPDFRVFVGLEELSLPMMALGASGLMNAAGNVDPGRIASLARAALEGRIFEARRLHYELFELNQAIFWDTNPIPIKYMLRKLGLIRSNEHRPPMASATADLEARLDEMLDKLRIRNEELGITADTANAKAPSAWHD
ncbi:MAG: 4-hydroxy-tetrahydrodipicolinate synthase [Sinimarinibacterium flocculans]|uniref:4-hydroxy-tetrahydrodipicolinate synthase n=1 Tax=Sinimarinibacterium flocculans TaxID=985250 RepID=UPI003C52D1FF